MSWKKSKFASSLMSLFGDNSATHPSPEHRVQEIRQAMLDCIGQVDEGHDQARVLTQVLYAPDIQSLWYIRPDVMTLVASLRGEAEAQARLASISDMFLGLLPAAQKTRPNRLHR
jgi:hypothetical protein